MSYQCDNCDVTAESLAGWLSVQVLYLEEGDNPDAVPSTRTGVGDVKYVFHAAECRDAWATRAGLIIPMTEA